ncbi:protein NipSnap-like [Centruroides vittatus]|uniref:protein NipSnap-like n=1 Tax=Centruroides vittatus TaxID=120091 RepID=UPI00350EFB8F
MASVWKVMTSCSSKTLPFFTVFSNRTLSTTSIQQSNGGEGWFSKLLHVRKIDPGKDSHSRLLSDADAVYELQIHSVKPDAIDPYLKGYEQWMQVLQNKSNTSELVGSWRVEIGDQDQFIHIWRFTKGYPNATNVQELCNTDPDLLKLHKDRVSYLRSRENQFMLAFSFWGHPQKREGKNMYEMRSYILKPGTMIEWGNNWARGINYRRSSAVAGFFSQIGQLYMVHHIWSYKDLQLRKDVREEAWRKPGWDECVAYTVPLIREMRSRWLRPNHFSPLQ